MIKDDHDFLDRAMKAYDNPSCVTLDEFNNDLSQIIYIKRAIKKYRETGEGLRRLVNMIVIFYNCFGTTSSELLLYKIKEQDNLDILVPIIIYLGWHSDVLNSFSSHINNQLVNQLVEL